MGIVDRVVVITGATGGLGSAAAARLAAEGARLALFSSGEEKLAGLARELSLPEDRLLTRALDLRDAGASKEAAAAVMEKFGRVDGLLHVVGGWIGGKPVLEVDPADVEEMLGQHLWTTFYLMQAFVPHMVAGGWGRLIAISHPDASGPPGKVAPYGVGKAAQEALFGNLAEELRGTSVTSNLILVRKIDVEREKEKAPTSKNAGWTTPEEIISAILYLISDEARVVNGARIPLYGRAWP